MTGFPLAGSRRTVHPAHLGWTSLRLPGLGGGGGAWSAAVFCMHPSVITKDLFYKQWLWQQLQAPLPCRIDINPHSNQTPLKHAPVEWNFLLNKVLLTQLPALWARAELSSHRRHSTLMNPLKYRLIGIAHWSRQTP